MWGAPGEELAVPTTGYRQDQRTARCRSPSRWANRLDQEEFSNPGSTHGGASPSSDSGEHIAACQATARAQQRGGVGSVGQLYSFYDDKVLRASGWIWLVHNLRLVGICPDCGCGVQIARRTDLAQTLQRVDEAEALHGCEAQILAPSLLVDLYGIERIARRFGFPEDWLQTDDPTVNEAS